MPLDLVDIPSFMPDNLFSLNQATRTAFSTANHKLRDWMIDPRLRSMLTFDHKQEGVDYYASPQPGDQFISSGAGGAVDGDTGQPSVWLYANDALGWMVWDLVPIDYTPTVIVLTLGNGQTNAHFLRMGRKVFVDYTIIFGSTTSFTVGPHIDFPSASNSPLDYDLTAVYPLGPGGTFAANQTEMNWGSIVDAAPAGGFQGFSRVESAATWRILRLAVSGANITAAGITATSPFTFTTDDVISGHLTYTFDG